MAGPTAFRLHIVVAFPDPLSSPARCLFPSSSLPSYQSLLLSRILASIVRRYCSISTPLHHHLRLLLAPTTAAKPAPSGSRETLHWRRLRAIDLEKSDLEFPLKQRGRRCLHRHRSRLACSRRLYRSSIIVVVTPAAGSCAHAPPSYSSCCSSLSSSRSTTALLLFTGLLVNTNEHTNRITTVQEQEQLELCMIYLHRLQLSTRRSSTTKLGR
ncbi:unnamed protein product [Sphagnum compactum]